MAIDTLGQTVSFAGLSPAATALFSAFGVMLYAVYNEWKRSKNTKERRTSVSHVEAGVSALKEEIARAEERFKKAEALHSRELEDIERTLRHKNDLALSEKELFEEERFVAKDESKNEQRAAVRGKFRVLRFDVIQKFKADLERSSAGFLCPALENKVCVRAAEVAEANVRGYTASLKDAFDEGEELAWSFILWNHFFELDANGLEQYIREKNKELHRVIWDNVLKGFPRGLVEGPSAERVTEEFTLSYFRDLISAVLRIRTQEEDRIAAAKKRYENAIRRIYCDRRHEGA